ncbi:MAG: FKBP-type peptidyl-prolyl cis-trans isomerase [Saprospiraceae bacterium]|nr:FKBP-type peptidyl-prolyl cis-trans isomerase [Saprospiraceae bacterium]
MRILLLAFIGFALFQTACTEKGIKTEHGFRFINHTNLKDGVKPQPGDKVLVNVTTFVGDTIMGSTWKTGGAREILLFEKDKLPKRIPPIYDALLLMVKGDSATIYQDLDSMMIASLPPALKKEKVARFEVSLVEVLNKEELAKKEEAAKAKGMEVQTTINQILADYKANKLGDRLKKTASGLEYVVQEQGTGTQVKLGDKVPTNYYGVLKSDGKMFDNSYDRGGATPFTVGQMIPGFDEGLQLMNRGGTYIFFIPSKLGYADQPAGAIPPNSDLVFFVNIES